MGHSAHCQGQVCNVLHLQAHPSESCQVLTLTLWLRVQTVITATSKLASFKIRPYLQPIQINAHFTWWPHSSLIAWAHWASNTELFTAQTLQPWWISEKLSYHWVGKKLQSQQWSPNLRRPFLRACEFSKFFCNYFPTSSVSSVTRRICSWS